MPYKLGNIPVGCQPPTSVATTGCQYQGVGIWYTYHPGYTYPLDYIYPWIYLSPRKDMGPEIPTPGKGIGIRDTYPPPLWTDTCENITFSQLRWRVAIIKSYRRLHVGLWMPRILDLKCEHFQGITS